MSKVGSFGSQLIKVRCANDGIAVHSNTVPSLLVRHNEQDIGFLLNGLLTSQHMRTGGECENKQEIESALTGHHKYSHGDSWA